MKESIPPYVDGWFGSERELTVIPIPEFPFQKNPTPDTYSRSYKRIYEVTPRVFLPKIANRTAWTNLLKYSEDQTNVAWTKTNVTATANAIVAPDGQTTMGKLLETSATGAHSISQAATTAAAATEASVFLKNGLSRSWVQLLFTDSAATVFSAFFNVDSGYVGTKSAGVTALVVPLGNGHFQCVLRFTPAAGAGTWAAKLSTDGATTSYAGDTAKGVYLWGAQIATGTVAPYVSTTSATRAVSAPDRDPLDPMAYLVEETDPTIENSETANTQRTFARVPREQIVPDFQFVTLPDIPGDFPQVFGGSIIIKPVATVSKYDLYAAQAVQFDTSNTPALSGGTYTLTFGGNTTSALAYNATASTVQSALNALTSITNYGGVVVTGSYTAGFVVTFNSLTAATVGVGSLTADGGGTARALFSGGLANNFCMGLYADAITGAGVSCNINGGTFTISVFGQTTAAIAYNATLAAVQTAVNLLSNVTAHGGCTVSPWFLDPSATTVLINPGSGAGLAIGFNLIFNAAAMTVGMGNALPANSAATVTRTIVNTLSTGGVDVSSAQTITFSANAPRVLTVPAHGLTLANALVFTDGTNYYYPVTTGFSFPDANSIALTAAAGAVFADTSLLTYVGKRTVQNYTPGAVQSRTNRVTDSYLPGVTPGVATAADIPLPVFEGDPASLLAAIAAGESSINYQIGELVQWKGPVLQRTITTLDASQLV